MVAYKCKTCGGQIEINGTTGFECPYCGSKGYLSDEDFKGNEEFRKRLLQFYRAEALKKENDYSKDISWFCRGQDSYTLAGGDPLMIDYMLKTEHDGYVCYLARESVIYVFDRAEDAKTFLAGVRRLSFPPADDKLHRTVPELKMELGLESGAYALVFRRYPNFYPAEYFRPWASEQLAWVISRMENICCLLKYSGIQHGNITPGSIWVNPVTHEGALFGDWRRVQSASGVLDLSAVRDTAIALAENTRDPKELYDFLNSIPEPDAFLDFEKWDKVIEKGFGGHKFVKMTI